MRHALVIGAKVDLWLFLRRRNLKQYPFISVVYQIQFKPVRFFPIYLEKEEGSMGDKNPKQKEKLKKQHKEEVNRKHAERQSHTHHFNPDGGGPNQHDDQGHKNAPPQHKKAG